MKQKTLKKLIFGIMLVLAIVLLNTNAFAAVTSTDTGSITITGLEEGVNVTIYQLVTVNWNDSSNQPTDPPYSWVSAVQTWVDANYPDYSDPEDFYDAVSTSSASAEDFYSALSAAIKAGDISLTETDSTTASASGEATFSGLTMGTYLVLIDNGVNVYQPMAVNLVPTLVSGEYTLESSVTETAKSSTMTISKTVSSSSSYTEKEEVANYGTNDTLYFEIVASVPKYVDGSTQTDYYISDVLSDGLTLTDGSIVVYGVSATGSETTLIENTAYTVGTTGVNTNTTTADFVLTFDYDEISSYSSIRVIYTATLDQSTTTVITNGNTNTAYLDYSNDPYSTTSSLTTQSDEVTVYTYGISVAKTDTSGDPLTGAQFNLYDADSNLLYFVQTSDGVYYLSANGTTGSSATLEVNSSTGILEIYGLDAGTYYLKETQAPSGYNLSTKTHTITLTDDDLDGVLDDGTTGVYSISVTNSQGFSLPETGGIGTVIFATLGVVLFGIGIVLLVTIIRRKTTTK